MTKGEVLISELEKILILNRDFLKPFFLYKYIAKAVYTLFYILTIGMLVFALIIYISGVGSVIPFASYFGYIYLAVLLITLVTIIINVVIAFSILIKKRGNFKGL